MTKTQKAEASQQLEVIASYCSACGQKLDQASRSFYQRHKRLFKAVLKIMVLVVLPYLIIGSFFNNVGQEIANQAEEDRIVSGSGPDTIALISIDGIIVETAPAGFGGISDDMTSSREIKKVLKEVKQDSSVKALLIRVNSPGGSASAAEEIYHDLKSFKAETKIPIIAYFADTAASGGYYVAMAADQIIANPSGLTGSIGVILSYLNIGDLAGEFGVKPVVYKSGEFKDLGNAFRDPTEAESAIFQSIIDDDYNNFVQAVVEGRKLDEASVRQLADGRIYSTKQAAENRLIDTVGYLDTAFAIAKEQALLPEASLVEFGQASFLDALIGSLSLKLNINAGLEQSALGYLLKQSHGPKVLYLYSQ